MLSYAIMRSPSHKDDETGIGIPRDNQVSSTTKAVRKESFDEAHEESMNGVCH